MSVIVKGMKMPEKCGLCDLFHAESPMHCTVVKGHKTVGAPYGMPRPEWCPLVELPEHHGRLIDADRLMRVYEDRLEKVIDRYGVDSSERGILSGAMKLLMIELGIVEAEGDE